MQELGVCGRIVEKPIKVAKKSLASVIVEECELYMVANGGKPPYKLFSAGVGKFFDQVALLDSKYIDKQECYAERERIDAEKKEIMDARKLADDPNEEFDDHPHIIEANDRLSAVGILQQVKVLYSLKQTFSAEVFVSDPNFNLTDQEFLKRLGCNVISSKNFGKLDFSIADWSGGSIILFTPFLPCNILEILGQQISKLAESTKLVIITADLVDQRSDVKLELGLDSVFHVENFIELGGTETCAETPNTGAFKIYGWSPVKK